MRLNGARAERERLRASIAEARGELSVTLSELRGAVRRRLDLRALVAARPLAAVALAALVGFRLGRGRWF